MTPNDETSAAFTELDWDRFDVWAIVLFSGLITIEERRLKACRRWLRRHDYETTRVDCSAGLSHVIPELGKIFEWERNFGYSLDADRRNLDALHDGFDFDVPARGGRVFEILRPDIAWQEDSRWLLGLLSIAQEYSHRQLALGRRFFTLLVMPEDSELIGQTIDETSVPMPFHNPARDVHEFES